MKRRTPLNSYFNVGATCNMPALFDAIAESTQLTEKSKKSYGVTLNSIKKRTADTPLEDVILQHKKYIPEFIKWFTNITTLKGVVTFILTIFRYNPTFKEQHGKVYDEWRKVFDDAKTKVDARYESNKPTEKQVKGFVCYKDILTKRDSLPAGSIERLLLDMYTHIPPMRCEYARVAIYRKVPTTGAEPNYIHIRGKKGTMIIQRFKTDKHHKPFDIDLPKPLMEDLLKSLADQPREWLFVNSRGEPYESVMYTQWTIRLFTKLFERPLTVALIRHSYINELDFNTLSIKERKDIAEQMAHTTETQERYKLIFDKKDPEYAKMCAAHT